MGVASHFPIGMSVTINPNAQTVTASRSLRRSGSSTVLTVPPEVLQALDLEAGDELEMVGSWEDDEITLRRV